MEEINKDLLKLYLKFGNDLMIFFWERVNIKNVRTIPARR